MIFIIGGGGFVGSAFVRYCEKNLLPYAVVEKDNYPEFVGKECDLLINANGNSKKFLAKEDPLREFDETVRSVRASLVNFRTKYYVHLSTVDVYPDCSSPASTREDSGIDISAQSPYGFHKYLAEQCVRYAAPRWLIIRFGGFVGPGLRKNPIYDILNGGPLWLDPQSALQYLHTDEAARIVFELANRGLDRQVVNVCGQGLARLEEVVQWVEQPVVVKPGSPQVCYDVSIEKLQNILPVPYSRNTVKVFVEEELARKRTVDDHHANTGAH